MFRAVVLMVAVFALVSVLTAVGLAVDENTVVIPQAIVPPRIDGRLNDAIWNAFDPVEWGYINTGGEVEDDRFSRSWAAYDDQFLYVAFENLEPDTGAITTVSPGHDSDVWMDDENELFIEPNNVGAQPYFHIMINAANVTQDDENGGAEAGWEPDLQSATQILNDRWILEVKIPFEDLGFDEAPVGETWGWNFNRHIVAGVDIWTSWVFVGASFHTPQEFGDLTFGLERVAVSSSGKLVITWGNVKAVQ